MGDLQSDFYRDSDVACSGCIKSSREKEELERQLVTAKKMLVERLELDETRKAVIELFTKDFEGHGWSCSWRVQGLCNCHYVEKKAALEALKKLETKGKP